MVKRLLTTMDSLGIEQVVMMPDRLGLAGTVIRDTAGRLSVLKAELLDFTPEGTYLDTLHAVEAMVRADCACIITLGGDGTNRIVTKVSRDIPLLPISAGTNNVFPYLVESTIAATAAAALVRESVTIEQACVRRPVLELYVNNIPVDIALIDLVVVDQSHVGARAVWDPDIIKEIFLTRARPQDIGLSSIGGCLNPMPLNSGKGLHLTIGTPGRTINAPITPGLVRSVSIRKVNSFEPGQAVVIDFKPCLIALDGEREIQIEKNNHAEVKIDIMGPLVIDIDATLARAVDSGFLSGPG